VNHIGGHYNFNSPWPVPVGDTTKRDFLNEGADEILTLGSRVIKIQLHPAAKAWYWYTANPDFSNVMSFAPDQRLKETAKLPQYVALFNKPFTTFVINVMANQRVNDVNGNEDVTKFGTYDTVLDGMSTAEVTAEKNAIQNLASYLLQTYAGSGKTFVIANGEADWILRDKLPAGQEPNSTRIQAMRDWINARQDGVTTARAAYGSSSVHVYQAAEVNQVRNAMTHTGVTMTNDVIPYTYCDLYSYTDWEVGPIRDAAQLTEALDYLETQAPDNATFGKHNIYLGEFGSAMNDDNGGDGEQQKELTRRMTEAALAWGCRYVLYWELYCNEPCASGSSSPCQYNASLWSSDYNVAFGTRPTNNQMRGLWLIKPDGVKAPVYYYFQSIMGQSVTHVGLLTSSSYYVSADDAGGGTIHVNAPWLRTWEYLTVIDRNGGALTSGDPINILTENGHYFMAADGGGSTIDATSEHPLSWEQLTILKSGGGTIGFTNTISLQASSGHYLVAENGGGGSNVLNANRTSIGPWEQFTMVSGD
jgi:hypothetical protein